MKTRSFTSCLIGAFALQAASLQGSESLSSAPLSPSPHEASTPSFTRFQAQQTGLAVDNAYDDPEMWRSRYREFMGGGMGSGVAAGDFDGDGKVDLYVSAKTKPGRLFKNLGNWKFVDVTEQAGLSEESSLFGWLRSAVSSDDDVVWRQGAVFVDVDNDGWLDLYVCRNNAPNLLYMNQGDGTFKEEAKERGLDLVDGSVVGAFADYDRDGWLDALILTNQVDGTEPNGRRDRLFHNNGNGRFTEVTQQSGIQGETFGHAATWFDYNGDKWPDLYIANDFSGPDHLYRNNRDGTFTNVLNDVAPHTPYSSMGADTGDIDNDGHIDLLMTDMATTTREKDRRGLAASRGDVLSTGTTEGVAPQYTRNALLLNTGLGIFREAASWAGIEATDWTWSVRLEDFDNDGWVDLHVTNGMVREANNSDLLARMMKALSDMQRISVIKRAPPLEESNLAYRNRRGNGFEPVTDEWGLRDVGVSFGAATADFDNDGDLDLAYLNYNGGLSVFRNDSPSQNRVQVRLQGETSNRFGVGAVIRLESDSIGQQTRSLTVARGYASGSELVAHFGLGPDERVSSLRVEWPSGLVQSFDNLEANRFYTVFESGAVEPSPASPQRAQFKDRSAALGLALKDASALAIPDNEQAFLPFRTDRGGPGLAVADLDGDGRDELFLGATTGSPARLLRWQGDSYAASTLEDIPASPVEDGPPLFFDATGDGAPDLLITQASAKAAHWPDAFQPKLYANDGTGQFSLTQALPKLALNAGAAIAADIDGDGDLDLFLGARSLPGHYPDTPRSALLRNDGGAFTDLSDRSPGLAEAGLVKSALFLDLEQNGLPDLILALEWDTVRYFRNLGDGRFVDATEEKGFDSGGRGWWNGLAAADFNGDGQLDIVAGNLGLNTTYHASPEQPATLFYGDFAQNGTRLLAEAVYDGDELYPLRSRVDIGKRLPFVLRKYPLNDAFAQATLAEVYGEKPLEAATRFEADSFQSGVFLSQPDGRYQFQALPRVAQIGLMQGLLAMDFDGDGHADIVATQNSDIAVPRFHGGVGLFLKGRGDGTFEAAHPVDSGIALAGNGRAIVPIDPDGDGRPDLLLTRHGGETVYLGNQGNQAPWLTLQLEGEAGNPHAIGAGVHLRYASGRSNYQQLGLGGGWYSQAAPKLYFPVPDEDPLVEAEIAWPDGSKTRHRNPPASGPWIIASPAAP